MKSNTLRDISAFAGIIAATSLSIGTAYAQEGTSRVLEEIVVTAAYREQGMQDVPV
jgi:hypothetical protein